MKFLPYLALGLGYCATSSLALARSDLVFITAIYKDVREYVQEYGDFVRDNPKVKMVPEIFKLLLDAQHITDDSFTTLIHPRFPVNDLKVMVPKLPWYTERLIPAVVKAYDDLNNGEWATVTPAPDAKQTLAAVGMNDTVPATTTS